MKKQVNRGFTLIELLVVVLIIGILAAVALPQYQKAVMKSRFVQLQVRLDALKKGIKLYRLANGTYPKDIRDLDMDIIGNGEATQTHQASTTHVGVIYPDGAECAITLYSAVCTDGYETANIVLYHLFETEKDYCRGVSAKGLDVCRSMTREAPFVWQGVDLYPL